MERISNKERIGRSEIRGSSVGEQVELSLFEAIQQLARKHARQPLDSEEATMRFLISWWCKYYNRPMKDPLLKEYTVEELAYEYYSIIERQVFSAEVRDKEHDKIEEEAWDEAEAWADQMEAEEAEAGEKHKDYNPLTDPDEIAWMEEQMRKDQEMYGEDFGGDLSMDFGDDDG